MASKTFLPFGDDEHDEDRPSTPRKKPCYDLFEEMKKAVKSSLPEIKEVVKSSLVEMKPFLQELIREELHVQRVHIEHPVHRLGFDMRLETRYQLCFTKMLPADIYTWTDFSVQVTILDVNSNATITSGPLSSKRIEVVVLAGDFGDDGQEEWTEEEFNKHVEAGRRGRGQLLKGQRQVNLNCGIGTFVGMAFKDNSSWTRSGKFRLGARMLQNMSSKETIKEARSQAFTVKEIRAEPYRKHHPPLCSDEVWRLEKIWKGGQYCKRLEGHGIKTVQDFLYWLDRDEEGLRCLLGKVGRKNWEAIVGHARECVPVDKPYSDSNAEPRVEPIVGPDIRLDACQKDKGKDLEGHAYEQWNDIGLSQETMHYNLSTADASQIIGSSSHQPQDTIPSPINLAGTDGDSFVWEEVFRELDAEWAALRSTMPQLD